jgi:hypothetical protein
LNSIGLRSFFSFQRSSREGPYWNLYRRYICVQVLTALGPKDKKKKTLRSHSWLSIVVILRHIKILFLLISCANLIQGTQNWITLKFLFIFHCINNILCLYQFQVHAWLIWPSWMQIWGNSELEPSLSKHVLIFGI